MRSFTVRRDNGNAWYGEAPKLRARAAVCGADGDAGRRPLPTPLRQFPRRPGYLSPKQCHFFSQFVVGELLSQGPTFGSASCQLYCRGRHAERPKPASIVPARSRRRPYSNQVVLRSLFFRMADATTQPPTVPVSPRSRSTAISTVRSSIRADRSPAMFQASVNSQMNRRTIKPVFHAEHDDVTVDFRRRRDRPSSRSDKLNSFEVPRPAGASTGRIGHAQPPASQRSKFLTGV